MKVLHLIFSMHTGGTETMLVDIVNEQVLHAEVTVVIVNNEVYEPIVAKFSKAVKLYKLNRVAGSKSVLPLVRLNYLIWRNKYDIIHCHNHRLAGMVLPFFKKNIFLTLHTTDIWSPYFKHYKMLFAISDAVADDLKQRTGLASLVVSNGVDFGSITPKNSEKNKSENELFRIIQVSRLDTDKKGQHVLIEAIGILKERGIKKVKVDFIGEGVSFNQLQNLVVKYDLKNQISFLGLKDRSYIYSHLKDYDILVQPSFYEGFGLTVVEGMAAKIPVLVSDIEGPMEVIRHGQYGHFFKCGDAQHLADKIQACMSPTQLNEKAEAAFAFALENYSIKNTALQYLKNYN